MSTAGHAALVTGAARRVGRAIALRLASAGYDVAISYLTSRDEAARLIEQIRGLGRRAIAIEADLTRPEMSVEPIFRTIADTFGRLDVLVNNASIYEPASLEETSVELMRRLWAIHVESPLLLCQRFAPLLRASGAGRVINMVDLLAERPWPKFMAYCASKAALANLTLSLARQLAPEVTVNGIAPGAVEWPENYPETEQAKYLQRVPLARVGTPEDVASLVDFLVTSAPYLTGQILRLDGGRSIT